MSTDIPTVVEPTNTCSDRQTEFFQTQINYSLQDYVTAYYYNNLVGNFQFSSDFTHLKYSFFNPFLDGNKDD